MNIDAGELRHTITFLTDAGKRDAEGYRVRELAEDLSPVCTCRAKWRRDSGREVADRDGDYGVEVGTFTIRYRAELNRKMLIRFQDRLYEIEDIDNYDGYSRWLKIRVKRKKQAGDET